MKSATCEDLQQYEGGVIVQKSNSASNLKNSCESNNVESWKNSRISVNRTHHVLAKSSLYEARFDEVLAFHYPGFAPVRKGKEWFYINPNGEMIFGRKFTRAFGFYEGRASVKMDDDWYHIDENGNPAYERKFAWCGNFQYGRCTVRENDLSYHHITIDGDDAYPERYCYAGDFREGLAVVKLDNDLCTHIDEEGKTIHGEYYLELDVYHKGFARARDENGWCHIDDSGKPVYQRRFQSVEPFYNGQSLCKDSNGKFVIIDENGSEIMELPSESLRSKISGPKILIIGTLGAGKTTIAKMMANNMELPFVSIDSFRQLCGDGTVTGEYRAWKSFIEMCERSEGSVLEFSGAGPHTYAVREALLNSGMPVILIWLDTPPKISTMRILDRTNKVPTPFPWGDLHESANSIYKGIEKTWSEIWTAKKEIRAAIFKNDGTKSIESIYDELLGFVDGELKC